MRYLWRIIYAHATRSSFLYFLVQKPFLKQYSRGNSHIVSFINLLNLQQETLFFLAKTDFQSRKFANQIMICYCRQRSCKIAIYHIYGYVSNVRFNQTYVMAASNMLTTLYSYSACSTCSANFQFASPHLFSFEQILSHQIFFV